MSDIDVLRELRPHIRPPRYEELVAAARVRRRRGHLGAAVAGVLLVLGAGTAGAALFNREVALVPAQPTSPSPSAPAPTEDRWSPEQVREGMRVIETAVDALYSGDGERAAELFDLPERDGKVRREAVFQGAIRGRLSLDCQPLETSPGVFSCSGAYDNALTDAIALRIPPDTFDAVVSGGVITEFHFVEHTQLASAIAAFLRDTSTAAHDPACAREFFDPFPEENAGPPSAACATRLLEHLEEWKAWYAVNG